MQEIRGGGEFPAWGCQRLWCEPKCDKHSVIIIVYSDKRVSNKIEQEVPTSENGKSYIRLTIDIIQQESVVVDQEAE